MSDCPVFVGLDIAKAEIDVVVRPSGEGWTAANDDQGVAALSARLQGLHPTLIVCETTGGYERTIIAACRDPGALCRAAGSNGNWMT